MLHIWHWSFSLPRKYYGIVGIVFYLGPKNIPKFRVFPIPSAWRLHQKQPCRGWTGKKDRAPSWFVKGNNTSLQKSCKLFRLCWLPLTRIALRGLNCCRSLKIDSPEWKPFQQLRSLAKTCNMKKIFQHFVWHQGLICREKKTFWE